MPINEKDTKSCPLCGKEILSAAKKCKHCGEMLGANSGMPAISRCSDPAAASSALGDIPTQKQLSARGFTTWAIISVLCGVVAGAFVCITGEEVENSIYLLVSTVSSALAIIYDCILSYRCWKIARLGHENEDPTPGKAIGFCFIPFFNLYWYFVTLPKLGARLCKFTGRQIGIAAAILSCVGWLSQFTLDFLLDESGISTEAEVLIFNNC